MVCAQFFSSEGKKEKQASSSLTYVRHGDVTMV